MLVAFVSPVALNLMLRTGERTEVLDGVPPDLPFIGHEYDAARDLIVLRFDDGQADVTEKTVTCRRLDA